MAAGEGAPGRRRWRSWSSNDSPGEGGGEGMRPREGWSSPVRVALSGLEHHRKHGGKDASAAGEEKRQLKPCNTERKRKAETEEEKLRAAKRRAFYAKSEEMDKLKVKRYANARGYYEAVEEFIKFQAWVRSEYAKNGYVEIDEDYLAHRL
ncbi:hypothetical protein TRIUR3_32201 [Triticum urartu]|uniref:Uncharacterized protein n=1 Tax=Triticum urartu TaxID=4572 RepID=M7ZX79_TRIUA|nr:hypothetical protein TRIUR3_32201 [Triticum urartu]